MLAELQLTAWEISSKCFKGSGPAAVQVQSSRDREKGKDFPPGGSFAENNISGGKNEQLERACNIVITDFHPHYCDVLNCAKLSSKIKIKECWVSIIIILEF